MPVFDFSDTPVANEHPECTYETFHSTETKASADKPIVVIDNKQKEWAHHALGMFTNPIKRTSFEFEDGDGVTSADILRIDSRFVSLFKWLGENHIKVQLSGANTPDGYAVYRVREVALGRGTKLSAQRTDSCSIRWKGSLPAPCLRMNLTSMITRKRATA